MGFKVGLLSSLGRLPTTTEDFGDWVRLQSNDCEFSELNVNFHWWCYLLSGSGALDSLKSSDTYCDVDKYMSTFASLERSIKKINHTQDEVFVRLKDGPRVSGLNYNNSPCLINYASLDDTFLFKTIESTLKLLNTDVSFIAVKVKSHIELLSALIISKIIRSTNKKVHISLVDHGYENFSLHSFTETLSKDNDIFKYFDTILTNKDMDSGTVSNLIDQIRTGRKLKGLIDKVSMPKKLFASSSVIPLFHSSYSSTPILSTRISKNRCYWNKCTYCVQNEKYNEESYLNISELDFSIERIKYHVSRGYNNFIFTDEALSPKMLKLLSRKLIDLKLSIKWTCRCKIEKAFLNEEFLLNLKDAGCFEILFGIESTSSRVLKKMGKFSDGIDNQVLGNILKKINATGITLHINLIGNFLDETVEELTNSVKFISECTQGFKSTTFLLNEFQVFRGTDIFRRPDYYGVSIDKPENDLQLSYSYTLNTQMKLENIIEKNDINFARAYLYKKMGLGNISSNLGARNAIHFYFSSGHGSIFKSMDLNPFNSLCIDEA